MNQNRVFFADFMLKLTDGLQERLAFDIADRAADFDDGNSCLFIRKIPVKTALDLIGDMRDNLNGSAAVITTALFLKNGPVYFTRCNVGIFIQIFIDEPFVMSEIQVGFRAVLRNKDFTVLNRIHRTRVDIDIRVKFLHGHFITACF